MSKVRINDLAKELEVKSRAILDILPEIGVSGGKTHSSSLEADEAERFARTFRAGHASAGASGAPAARRSRRIAPKIDLSHISKPGDVMKAILAKKKEEEEEARHPQRACHGRLRLLRQHRRLKARSALRRPHSRRGCPCSRSAAPPEPRKIVPQPRSAPPIIAPPPASPAIASRPPAGPVVAKAPAGAAAPARPPVVVVSLLRRALSSSSRPSLRRRHAKSSLAPPSLPSPSPLLQQPQLPQPRRLAPAGSLLRLLP